MSLLVDVVGQLEKSGIRCALIGAEALSLRGASRSTLDRDLLTTDPRSLVEALWAPVRLSGSRCEIRRGDAEDPLAGVVRFTAEGERPVDLIVGRYGWQTRILERSEMLDLGELRIPVARPADLILLKLFAGGGQDSWDIVQLLAGGYRESVIAEVEARIDDLPVEARQLWQKTLAG